MMMMMMLVAPWLNMRVHITTIGTATIPKDTFPLIGAMMTELEIIMAVVMVALMFLVVASLLADVHGVFTARPEVSRCTRNKTTLITTFPALQTITIIFPTP